MFIHYACENLGRFTLSHAFLNFKRASITQLEVFPKKISNNVQEAPRRLPSTWKQGNEQQWPLLHHFEKKVFNHSYVYLITISSVLFGAINTSRNVIDI